MDVITRINNNIVAHKEFQELEEFVTVKKLFPKEIDVIVIYIYYMYKSDSIYADMYPRARQEEVCRRYNIGVDYEKSDHVKALIKAYNNLSKSREERHRDDVLRDMEDLIDMLHATPYSKKAKVKDGDKYVETTIDNTDEKIKHIKSARELIDLSEKYKTMITKQKIQDKYKGRRMFDKDSNTENQ